MTKAPLKRGRIFLESKMADKIFAYVPHSKQKLFEELGWEFSTDLGPPHAAYASLYEWAGDGLPVYPKDDITVLRDAVMEDPGNVPNGKLVR